MSKMPAFRENGKGKMENGKGKMEDGRGKKRRHPNTVLRRIVAIYRKADLERRKRVAPDTILINIPQEWDDIEIKEQLREGGFFFDDDFSTHWNDNHYIMREVDPGKWGGTFGDLLAKLSRSSTVGLEWYEEKFRWV